MKYAFCYATLLDGSENMEPKPGMTVLVEDDRIVKIQPSSEIIPEDYELINLAGRYLMPGLVNMHVHIPATGKPAKKQLDAKKAVRTLTRNKLTRKVIEVMYRQYVKPELFSGVTTIRTVGGVEEYDAWLRDQVNAGKAVGPRILASNMAVSVPGGHMAGSLAYEASSEEDAVKYVDKIAAGNADLIKLMITGGVLDAEVKGEPGVLKMKPEIIKAACDEAKRLGYYVSAHVESTEGLKAALENGVTSIEHGAAVTPEIIDLFKEKNAFLITTISPSLPFALFDQNLIGATEVQQYNGKIVMDGIIECAKACLENGIPVGLGTDTGCPYTTHYNMWRELVYFTKYCGVSNSFALHTATAGNAKLAGILSETGTIEEGKCADLVVTDRNPLEDLTALRDVRMVMARGKLFKDPKVRKYEDAEKELDKYL